MPGYESFFDDIKPQTGGASSAPVTPPARPSSTPVGVPAPPSVPSAQPVSAPGAPDPEPEGLIQESVPDAPSAPEDSGVISLEQQFETPGPGELTLEQKLELIRYQPQRAAVGSGAAPVAMPGARVTSDKMIRVEIHKELYDVIKTFVVGGSNKTDVLEAFICAWAGDYVPVPDNVRELISSVKTPPDRLEETTETTLDIIKSMQKHLKAQDRALDVIQLCAMWTVAEKLGLSVSFTSNVNKADFVFPDYDSMLRQLSSQIAQHQDAKRRRIGRAIGEQAMRNRNGGK